MLKSVAIFMLAGACIAQGAILPVIQGEFPVNEGPDNPLNVVKREASDLDTDATYWWPGYSIPTYTYTSYSYPVLETYQPRYLSRPSTYAYAYAYANKK